MRLLRIGIFRLTFIQRLVIGKQLSGRLQRLQDDVSAKGFAAFEVLIGPVEGVEKPEGPVVDVEPAIPCQISFARQKIDPISG